MNSKTAIKAAVFGVIGLAIGLAAAAAIAAPSLAPAPAQTPAAPAPGKPLTIESNFGALVDNAKTNAVLKKLAPGLLSNPTFLSVGRDISLRAMAQYDDSLTAQKLKDIDAELAKAQSN